MRFSYLLPLLPLCWAASKDALNTLVDLAAAGNGLINLDGNTFDLLTSPKRNWSASIQFTAMDQRRRCAPCREFDPSWVEVAKAWSKTPKEQRDQHFFATLDFDNSQVTFQKLGLQSAPVVFVYPAAEGPRQLPSGRTTPSKYDFSHGFEAGPLAEHLSNHTPIPIPYKPPFDYAGWALTAVGGLACLLTLRFISPILQSRWTWAAGSIVTMLVMVSGFMFTRIRGSPFTGGDGSWIAAGYQNQYGQEVQVIAMIYGILAATIVILIVQTPKQTSPNRQRLQIYAFTAANLLVYSILVTIFRVKNRGYPFKLLF
ncbi:OST3/OST6 family protein [Pleurotus pulmonarius]|nr:oligosaccharyl transferase subunit ost3/OST6 [Pleurotus pulmonarius]KAF4579012.1 oligosaccharyl transferase subunit ost3/OST6 [Pleurotus pulmonarius]KAF4603656.1 oligosaccharyl transferase subunit ost3/OST6 [Pleurotus pulmonarius]